MPTNLPLARLAAETIDLLVIAPKRGELMRYLGHSRSKAQTKRLPEFFEWALIAQAAPPPRSAYCIYRSDPRQTDCLFLAGASLAGQVATLPTRLIVSCAGSMSPGAATQNIQVLIGAARSVAPG